VPNEAEHKETRADVKLETLANVERVVNEYAKIVAAKHGVNKDHFQVHLTRQLGGVLKLVGGPTVDIFLLWPDAQPNINTLLNDAFRLMRKYPVRRTMEIVPIAYARTMSKKIKNMWKKEKFTDESEIVLDLIPRHRLRVKKIETTILEDVVSGEKLTIVHEYPTDRFDWFATGLWLQLSRIVRDRHPEPELPDDEPSPTPILDEVVETPEYVDFMENQDAG
jgi:hypothetical protein